MSIALEDLVGLNRTQVHDLPIVDSATTAGRLRANGDRPLALAGMRHSQGGHAVVENGRVLQTAMFNETIDIDPVAKTVVVDAGVTWTELHRKLAPHGLCPRVHQSSPHFTVGGSISVNCHGRDPHAGPISTTVLSLHVLCGDGQTLTTGPGEDLFRAVVGGYGSCAMILQAKLALMDDAVLEQKAEVGGLPVLRDRLAALAQEPAGAARTQLFYAWLNCEEQNFWDDALLVSYAATGGKAPRLLKEEDWGESEILRAAWSAARLRPGARTRMWQELCKKFLAKPTEHQYRLNWMRAAVDFTSHRDARSSDILLEHFLPLHADLDRHLFELGQRLRPGMHILNILSTTVRLVRQDTDPAPHLAYCAGRPMVCVAIDAAVAVDPNAAGRPAPTPAVRKAVNAATAYVLGLGGSYYLPYYGFATPELFLSAYPHHQRQRNAIQAWNPKHRYWNAFLQQYLA